MHMFAEAIFLIFSCNHKQFEQAINVRYLERPLNVCTVLQVQGAHQPQRLQGVTSFYSAKNEKILPFFPKSHASSLLLYSSMECCLEVEVAWWLSYNGNAFEVIEGQGGLWARYQVSEAEEADWPRSHYSD